MRRRRWNSGAARALMAVTGIADPHAAMVQCVVELLDEAEVISPPVDLPLVASFRGVRAIQYELMSQAGRLIPDSGGFIIQVNMLDPLGRQNFTIGHEIGHTLVPTYQANPQLVEDGVTGHYDTDQEEEYLCDVAAAEILMPMALFKPLAADGGFNLDTAAALATAFRASRRATALRLVQTDLWPSAVAVWRYAHKPSEQHASSQLALDGFEGSGPPKKLRLQWAFCNPAFGHFLHRHLAADPVGCISRCFEEGGVVCGEEHFDIRPQAQPFFVMAAAMDFADDNGATREVVSLILSEGRRPPEAGAYPRLWSNQEQ